MFFLSLLRAVDFVVVVNVVVVGWVGVAQSFLCPIQLQC